MNYPHTVTLSTTAIYTAEEIIRLTNHLDEVAEWCVENLNGEVAFDNGEFDQDTGLCPLMYRFEDERDAILFKLRWQ